jgi:hypothetical protein
VSFDNSNTASVIADKVRDGSSVTFFIDSVTELSTLTEGQSDWNHFGSDSSTRLVQR